MGFLAQLGIAVIIREHRLAVFEQQHMHVHTAACLAVNRLGHQRCGLAVLQCGVADDILDHHAGIGHGGHLAQHGLDLELTGGAHLRMMVLHRNTRLLHEHHHFAAALIGGVEGLGNVVVLLLGDDIALALGITVPVGLLVIQVHADGIGLNLPTHLVEEVELKFRQDQHGICHAGVTHILFCRQDDVPGILIQGTVGGMIDDHGVAGHGQGRDLAEGVHHSGIQIGDKHHVTLFHHGIAIVGSVKAHAVPEQILIKVAGGNGHMAELAVDIHHLKVDHLNIFLPDHIQNILQGFCHKGSSLNLRFFLLYPQPSTLSRMGAFPLPGRIGTASFSYPIAGDV